MPTPQTSTPPPNKSLATDKSPAPEAIHPPDNPNPITDPQPPTALQDTDIPSYTDPIAELQLVAQAAQPLLAALDSRQTLRRISVQELIDLSISLAREQGRKDTEDKLTHRIYELEATIATLQRELGRYRPPLAWYMTNNAIWIHNPDNPGRPTAIARMSHAGVMLVHSRAVWNWLKTILPAPPRLEELRKLHGDDYPPTGSLPVATPTPVVNEPASKRRRNRSEKGDGETA